MNSRRLRAIRGLGLGLVLALVAGPAFGYDCYTEVNPIYYETDVRSLIHAVDRNKVETIRNQLIQYIWKAPALPTALPDVVSDVPNPFPVLSALPEGTRVEELSVSIDDYVSRMYLFVPPQPRRRLMIVHQGHTKLSLDGTSQTVQLFLEQRYFVLVVHMPLYGPNTGPFGPVPYFHTPMFSVESPTLSPFKYFLEPVVRALNYVEATLRIRRISMIGLSGGGWTTTLAAAIDPRIRISIPVAGSLPLYLFRPEDPCQQDNKPDREQNHPELFAIADYLDLYILGSYGRGRAQLQVLNMYDRCCFEGVRFITYSPIVKQIVDTLRRGNYDLFLDSSHHGHRISDYAMEKAILPFLKRGKL